MQPKSFDNIQKQYQQQSFPYFQDINLSFKDQSVSFDDQHPQDFNLFTPDQINTIKHLTHSIQHQPYKQQQMQRQQQRQLKQRQKQLQLRQQHKSKPKKKKKYTTKSTYDSQGNKEYLPRRIFMCGQCHSQFKFNQELAYHINTQHNQLPDGTIYGVMKDKIFQFFGLPILTAGVNQRQVKYKCGCGKIYGCSSSLKVHILKKHDGQRPPGTKGAVSRRPKDWMYQKQSDKANKVDVVGFSDKFANVSGSDKVVKVDGSDKIDK